MHDLQLHPVKHVISGITLLSFFILALLVPLHSNNTIDVSLAVKLFFFFAVTGVSCVSVYVSKKRWIPIGLYIMTIICLTLPDKIIVLITGILLPCLIAISVLVTICSVVTYDPGK